MKLAKVCGKPTPKGLDVLSRFRRGLGPNMRVRQVLDRALPVHRLAWEDAGPREVQVATSVPKAFSDAPEAPPHERRMAALLARVKEKEDAKRASES